MFIPVESPKKTTISVIRIAEPSGIRITSPGKIIHSGEVGKKTITMVFGYRCEIVSGIVMAQSVDAAD